MESIAQWQERLPGASAEKIKEWINSIGGRGFNKAQIEQFLYDNYDVFQGKMTQQSLEQKWSAQNFDVALNKVANHMKISPAQKTLPQPDVPEAAARQKSMIPQEDTADDTENDTDDDTEGEEELDENMPEGEEEGEQEGLSEPSPELKRFNVSELPEAKKPTIQDGLPYDNPDPRQFIAEQQEAEEEIPQTDKIGTLKEYMQKSFPGGFTKPRRQGDFITTNYSQEQFVAALKPYGAFLNRTKNEPMLLIDLARSIDIYNHPPYMQLRPIIINNGILDLANTKVLLNVLDEEIPDRTVQRYIQLPDAWMMTRRLVEQNYLTSAMLNYDAIIEKILNAVIPALQANIALLSIYCETKKQSPFEVSIPRIQLASSIMEAFEDIKGIIQNQLVKELANLRTDMAGELLDVHAIVEKNFGKFDVQIRDAIESVMWKVKTDIDATNKEDIKRVDLYTSNKLTASFSLGAPAVAVMAVMVNDLKTMIAAKDYKTDEIKEYRRYTSLEIQKKLHYTQSTVITKAIIQLFKNKLIIIYKDKTFQLSK